MLRAPLSERFTLFEKGCSVTFDGEEEAHPEQSAPPPLVFGRIGVWLCAILHTDFREFRFGEVQSAQHPAPESLVFEGPRFLGARPFVSFLFVEVPTRRGAATVGRWRRWRAPRVTTMRSSGRARGPAPPMCADPRNPYGSR